MTRPSPGFARLARIMDTRPVPPRSIPPVRRDAATVARHTGYRWALARAVRRKGRV